MKHDFSNSHQVTCPNCSYIVRETSYEMVFACINPSCNWMMGPTQNVVEYIKFQTNMP